MKHPKHPRGRNNLHEPWNGDPRPFGRPNTHHPLPLGIRPDWEFEIGEIVRIDRTDLIGQIIDRLTEDGIIQLYHIRTIPFDAECDNILPRLGNRNNWYEKKRLSRRFATGGHYGEDLTTFPR